MATACSILLAEQQSQKICMWMREQDYAVEVQETRDNARFLPGVKIPSSIEISGDIEYAVKNSEYLVVAIPSAFLRESLTQLSSFLKDDRPTISVVKGMENDTLLRPSEIITDVLGNRTIAVLAGPSHAEEISKKLPASVVAASGDVSFAKKVQSMFTTNRFRVYTNLDVIGVELAGAVKNVIAISAGICDGMEFGDNAKSALLSRGLVEMARFGQTMGAEESTFYGLAGIGDLMTTCFSPYGRNRHVGVELGKGKNLTEIIDSMEGVAEGVPSCKSIYQLADSKGIDMPITSEVYEVLFNGKSPVEATHSLMSRPPQAE